MNQTRPTSIRNPNRSPIGYRGRFAPSPSGPLHLGSILTALASFLDARSCAGEWLVRIDDIDPYRTQPGAADQILASLESLGLVWDGQVVYQSLRRDMYYEGLEQLKSDGLIYACDCSRRQLTRTPVLPDKTGVYPGLCRYRELAFIEGQHALRMATENVLIQFEDGLQGPVSQSLPDHVGDFAVYRRDGVFAYHLATVLDDAEQGISHIVRGQDLLESTPRQIYLQQQLALPTPHYAHTPILIDSNGRKLSKGNGAPAAETRDPTRILGYLLTKLGHPPPKELRNATVREVLDWAIPNWQLARLFKAGPAVMETDEAAP